MKIGIVTYHRSHNYGALMQAYALKNYLISLGHDASFVDYWPSYRNNQYKNFSPFVRSGSLAKKISLFPIKLIEEAVTFVPRFLRTRRFDFFIKNKILNNSYDFEQEEKYDYYIFGSDQIWRHNKLPNFNGFDYFYFGEGSQFSGEKIAYAASMGVNAIDSLTSDEISKVKELLLKFKSISVREYDLSSSLKSAVDLSTSVVLDPVFLLNQNEWQALVSEVTTPKKKYILLYNLTGSQRAKALSKIASEKLNYEIIEIVGHLNRNIFLKNTRAVVGPMQFLSLIMNSEFVISSSFHGVAFSIVFRKQFYSLGIGKNSSRVKSLLNIIGINERYIEDSTELDKLSFDMIDYGSVTTKLDEKINFSKDFLIESLKN